MNPLVKYSLARLVIFLVVLSLLAWAGAGGLWSILLAAVVSMLVAYVALRSLRLQAAEYLQKRAERRLQQVPEVAEGSDEQVEDAEVEAQTHSAEGKPEAQ